METYPPNPVQSQRTAELVAQFGIDLETPSGRALVHQATDGAPLVLPDPPEPRAASAVRAAPDPATADAPLVDLVTAHAQRAALTQPSTPAHGPTPQWDRP